MSLRNKKQNRCTESVRFEIPVGSTEKTFAKLEITINILINNKYWIKILSMNNLKAPSMQRSSIIILQVVIVVLGIGTLAFMLWEPHIEGRNVHATLFEIYFNDPFLAYMYTGSIAFFVALYQAFKLLGYIGQNKLFSLNSVKALRAIKYCAKVIVGFIVVAEAYLFIVRPGDDIAGGVFMGLLIIFVSGIVATVTAMFEKILQNAMEIKS